MRYRFGRHKPAQYFFWRITVALFLVIGWCAMCIILKETSMMGREGCGKLLLLGVPLSFIFMLVSISIGDFIGRLFQRH